MCYNKPNVGAKREKQGGMKMKKIVFLTVLMIAVLCAANAMADVCGWTSPYEGAEVAWVSVEEDDIVRTYFSVRIKNLTDYSQRLSPIKLGVDIESKDADKCFETVLMSSTTWPCVVNPGRAGYISFELARAKSKVDVNEKMTIDLQAGCDVTDNASYIGHMSEIFSVAPMLTWDEATNQMGFQGESYFGLIPSERGWVPAEGAVVYYEDTDGKLRYAGYTCEPAFLYGNEEVRIPCDPRIKYVWADQGVQCWLNGFTFWDDQP